MAESRRYALTPQLGEDLIDLASFFGELLLYVVVLLFSTCVICEAASFGNPTTCT